MGSRARLAAIGELTRLITHEVRQPLTAIVAQAGACHGWLGCDPPDIAEAVAAAAQIVANAQRASGVMDSIRRMTSKSPPSDAARARRDAVMTAEACSAPADAPVMFRANRPKERPFRPLFWMRAAGIRPASGRRIGPAGRQAPSP